MKYKDLSVPIARARTLFQQLKEKYPKMDAYLMVDSRLGQVEPGSSGSMAIKNFKNLFLEGPAKEQALTILKEISNEEHLAQQASFKDADSYRVLIQSLNTKLNQLVDELDVDENAQISLRFGELDYKIVRALQNDPIVDQELTPKIASINIVLGTLKRLIHTGRQED